jgi:plastocyanin
MKANLIIVFFVVFLSLYALWVATLKPTANEIDNVSYQQLEMHRSVLEKQEQDTQIRYATDNGFDDQPIKSQMVATPAEYTVEIGINGSKFTDSNLTVDVGTTVFWTNEDLTMHTLTLSDATGAIDKSFGNTSLRQGDKIYFKFNTPGVWEIYDPNQSDTLYGFITVV